MLNTIVAIFNENLQVIYGAGLKVNCIYDF